MCCASRRHEGEQQENHGVQWFHGIIYAEPCGLDQFHAYNWCMNQTNIGIRRASTRDAVHLATISEGSATGTVELSKMSHWLKSPGIFSYAAEDEQLFGFVTVGPEMLTSRDGSDGQVLAWAVQPSHRQRGMGRKLLVHGLSVLKRRMFTRAIIWLPEEAVRAQVIVGKIGFEMNGTERWDNIFAGTNDLQRANDTEGLRAPSSRKTLCYARDLGDFF